MRARVLAAIVAAVGCRSEPTGRPAPAAAPVVAPPSVGPGSPRPPTPPPPPRAVVAAPPAPAVVPDDELGADPALAGVDEPGLAPDVETGEPAAPAAPTIAAAPGGDQVAAYCAHRAGCGCPMPDCDATMARMIASPPVQDVVACVVRLACADTCTDMADPASPVFRQCVGPVRQAMVERGQVIDTVQQMTRDVIDHYPGSTRVDIYDAEGRRVGEGRR